MRRPLIGPLALLASSAAGIEELIMLYGASSLRIGKRWASLKVATHIETPGQTDKQRWWIASLVSSFLIGRLGVAQLELINLDDDSAPN